MSSLLTPTEQQAVREFGAFLATQFGERVEQLTLFGSRARGEGHAESDVDVLVVIRDLTGAERCTVNQRSGDALTSFDVLLSPFVVSSQRWRELCALERLFAREVQRDGVALDAHRDAQEEAHSR